MANDWRSALQSLTNALETASGPDLAEAKAALELALEGVVKRAQEHGGASADPLLDAMCTSAQRATEGRIPSSSMKKLVASLTARVKVQVDDWDLEKGVTVSAKGEWSILGKKYKLSMAATELEGCITAGRIDFCGLNFIAAGNLSKGSFNCEKEIAEWASIAVVDISPADMLRAVVSALEVLVKKRAKGIADIDILKLGFNLMKTEAGVPQPAASVPRRRLTSKKSVAPAAISVTDMEGAHGGDFSACATELEERCAVIRKVASPATASSSAVALNSETPQRDDVRSAASKKPGKTSDQPQAAPAEEEDDEVDADEDGSLASDEDEDDGSQLSEADGASEQDGEDRDGEDDGDGCAFASKAALDKWRADLEKGIAPSANEILAALDTENLPDDDELLALDTSSILGSGCEADLRRALSDLIKKEGPRKVAELLIKCSDAAEEKDEQDVEEDEEEGFEEDEEEEDANEDMEEEPACEDGHEGKDDKEDAPVKLPDAKRCKKT